MQQITFSGHVVSLFKEKTKEFFEEKPQEAQAVTALSKQSETLFDEMDLKEKIQRLIDSKENRSSPQMWQAYYLIIDTIEFWIGSKDRCSHR